MQLGTTAAIVVSAVVLAIGVFVALSAAGSDTAVFGWFLTGVGALSALVNLLHRARR